MSSEGREELLRQVQSIRFDGLGQYRDPVVASLVVSNAAAFVPVFGGPEYNPSTNTGYQAVSGKPYPFERNLVNNNGTVEATLQKSAGFGSPQFQVPLKWQSSSAPG